MYILSEANVNGKVIGKGSVVLYNSQIAIVSKVNTTSALLALALAQLPQCNTSSACTLAQHQVALLVCRNKQTTKHPLYDCFFSQFHHLQ